MIVPEQDDPLEAGDELLFVTSEDVEDELAALLSGGHREVGLAGRVAGRRRASGSQ